MVPRQELVQSVRALANAIGQGEAIERRRYRCWHFATFRSIPHFATVPVYILAFDAAHTVGHGVVISVFVSEILPQNQGLAAALRRTKQLLHPLGVVRVL
jgi:ABC-type nitrate/sulfonate/bicarbonate transport system permease component